MISQKGDGRCENCSKVDWSEVREVFEGAKAKSQMTGTEHVHQFQNQRGQRKTGADCGVDENTVYSKKRKNYNRLNVFYQSDKIKKVSQTETSIQCII